MAGYAGFDPEPVDIAAPAMLVQWGVRLVNRDGHPREGQCGGSTGCSAPDAAVKVIGQLHGAGEAKV